jgi:hypothetical protein
MRIFTIKDVERLINEQNYKFCGLFDQSGKTIIPFNPNGKLVYPLEKLKEIENRINSEILPDGYYTIKCKTSVRMSNADNFVIYKGNLSETDKQPVTPLIVEKPIFQPEVLTYEGALKLQIELERLKLENASLKKEIENLNDQLSEIDEATVLNDSENSKNEMFQNAKTFLSEAMGFVAPLLDKHFELKEKALGLKALEIRDKQQTKQTQQPTQQKTVNVSDWIQTYENDPDTYNQLVEIYNTAKSPNEFFDSLKEFNLNLFNDWVSYGK